MSIIQSFVHSHGVPFIRNLPNGGVVFWIWVVLPNGKYGIERYECYTLHDCMVALGY